MRLMRLTKISALFAGIDWVLILSVLTLAAFGLVAIYSIDVGKGAGLAESKTQLFALGISLIVMVLCAKIPKSAWRSYSLAFFTIGVLLLLYVAVFGTTIRGTKGWIFIAGFSFQPVELMKVALVCFMAYLIERGGRAFHSFFFFSKTAVYAGVAVLLILLQPDLGSAVVLFVIWLGLMLIVGIRRRYVLVLSLVLVALGIAAWFFILADYQKDRIRTFLDPNHDPLGAGYNVQQSMIAVGSGRVFGRGLGSGSQTQLRFLPEGQTDFIFSVIAEELGFAAVSVVFIAFFVIWYRLMKIALTVRDDFGLFVVLGAMVLLFTEITINIGATLGMLPVTGITLPFMSAGGSSLLMHSVLMGIVMSIGRAGGQRGAEVFDGA